MIYFLFYKKIFFYLKYKTLPFITNLHDFVALSKNISLFIYIIADL